MARIRLQKILSEAGVGSRRTCEAYILAGRVKVDGVPVTQLGSQADPDIQKITFDGTPVRSDRKVHYLLNKPPGYICSNKPDRSGRPLAKDLVRIPGARLFCAGRLDVDSKGALIVTNDGEFANRVTHPRYGMTKTYRVRVEGEVGPDAIERLRKGVWLSEGKAGGIEAKVLRSAHGETVLRVVLGEGKNREIRRVFAKLGLRVTELERTRIGDVALGKLGPGDYRPLSSVEVRKLSGGK